MIEAGPSDEGRDEILRLIRWPELLQSDYDYDYTVEPSPGINPEIRQSRGRILGGCSSHNVCCAWRPPDHDLLAWEAAGARGWGPDDLAPSLDRVLDRTGLEHARPTNDAAAAFIQAGKQAGYEIRQWNAEGGREGVGWVPINAVDGWRRSSSVAYLHPLNQLPPNLAIRTGEPAVRILFEGTRAAGVQTTSGPVLARRETIVCCGAFDTPKLLLLSGVGPAHELQALGIRVVANLPVGERLMDHPEGVLVYETTRAITQPDTTWVDAVLQARTPHSPGSWPDTMIWFFSGHFNDFSTKFGSNVNAHAFSLGFDVLYARSEGRVSLISPDPNMAPRIEMRYFTDQTGDDEKALLAGLALARDIARQPALVSWIKREIAPGVSVTDTSELLDYAKSTVYTAYHPSGTCRLGAAGDWRAVVDPDLRVRGLAGLRVADASIFPAQIGVNPNITCMAVGDRAAELIARG